MARVPELAKFAKAHKLKMVTIKALIEYRMQRETFVQADGQCAAADDVRRFRSRGIRKRIR